MELEEAPLWFTTRVLGPGPAQRLRDRKVRQTVRSHKHTAPFLGAEGKKRWIELDGVRLYKATIESIKRGKTDELGQEDADAGGFDDMDELNGALIRAGFRFRPSYDIWKIRFVPDSV